MLKRNPLRTLFLISLRTVPGEGQGILNGFKTLNTRH
jgi:hypothetical protein